MTLPETAADFRARFGPVEGARKARALAADYASKAMGAERLADEHRNLEQADLWEQVAALIETPQPVEIAA